MAFRARRVMRRRTVARAAVVGGTAYYAGKKGAERAQGEASQDQQLADLEAQQPAQPQQATPAPAQPDYTDYTAELEQLAELKSQGILTEEEFQAKKKQILGI
jgi:hypothetical protein